jgi:hypothetical protein
MQDSWNLALAELLPLLQCGEDSAVVAFERLNRRQRRLGADPRFTAALKELADDERRHVKLLASLAGELPVARADDTLRESSRKFFAGLVSDSDGTHFARIAALDSAVCLVLGTIRQAQPQRVAGPLDSIARDESRHAAFALAAARELCTLEQRAMVAAQTRAELARLLSQYGRQFDALQVDPDRLLRRVARPPRALCCHS